MDLHTFAQTHPEEYAALRRRVAEHTAKHHTATPLTLADYDRLVDGFLAELAAEQVVENTRATESAPTMAGAGGRAPMHSPSPRHSMPHPTSRPMPHHPGGYPPHRPQPSRPPYGHHHRLPYGHRRPSMPPVHRPPYLIDTVDPLASRNLLRLLFLEELLK